MPARSPSGATGWENRRSSFLSMRLPDYLPSSFGIYYSSYVKGRAFCSNGIPITGIQIMSASMVSNQSRPKKRISTPVGSGHRLTKWDANNAPVGSDRLTPDACSFSSQFAGAEEFAS
jgi:hypothetical protein